MRRVNLRQTQNEWLGACLLGGVLFGLHQILFLTSIEFTSVANATIIGAL
jgi:drug/metabolite transporter (DMT)-like permease